MNPESIDSTLLRLPYTLPGVGPILHLLRVSNGRYNEIQESAFEERTGNSLTENDSSIRRLGINMEHEELSIKLLNGQINLMITLNESLVDLSTKCEKVDLITFEDNISRPLMEIISSCGQKYASHAAHQSARFQAVAVATETLANFVMLLVTPLTSKQSVHYIVTCVMSIPTHVLHDGSLDWGVDCEKGILGAIRAILSNATLYSEIDHELAVALTDSNIVAQIVATCVAAISFDDNERHKDIGLQSDALLTLDSLLASFKSMELWQHLFPGCFVGLCRLALAHAKTNKTSPDVVSKSVFTISTLFERTIQTDEPHDTNDQSVESIIDALKSMMKHHPDQHIISKTGNAFADDINARLPSFLPTLLNSLHSSSSPKIRLAATELCRRVLLHVCCILKSENRLTIQRCALDASMILTRDIDKVVATAAKAVFHEYKSSMGECSWKIYWSDEVSSRIIEMMGKASILAKSEREADFRATIKLLSTYLECVGELGRLRWDIESLDLVRRELMDIFDIDFDSIYFSSLGNANQTLKQSIVVNESCAAKLRLRHFGEDTMLVAKEFIQSLTLAMGQKHTHQFIDAAIVDLFQSCSQRERGNASALSGMSQELWLREWTGIVFVVNEMIACDITDGTRVQRNSRKRLDALKAAIVPILTSAPLWTLPSKSDTGRPSTSPNLVSALVLKGNAVLVCLLASIVGTLLRKREDDGSAMLSIALFPLIEKTSANNHWIVQHEALRVLNEAATTQSFSVAQLVEENVDYIFAALLTKLTLRGGIVYEERRSRAFSEFSDLVVSILHILCTKSINSNSAKESLLSGERTIERQTQVSNLIEVVTALTFQFDTTSRKELPAIDDELMLLSLLRVYSALIRFIKFTLNVNLSTEDTPHAGDQSNGVVDKWMRVLEPFRIKSVGASVCPISHNSSITQSALPCVVFSREEVNVLSLILARCGFSLSSPNLQIKVASVATQADAFGVLGLVAEHQREENEEENINQSPRTAVLRQIHDSWPSVTAALLSLHKFVSASATTSVYLTTEISKNTVDSSSHYFFLSLIYDLITSMCDAAGDFIVGRLKDDVWPTLPKVLGIYLGKASPVSNALPTTTQECKSSSRLPLNVDFTEKDKLLFAILRFLKKSFGNKKVGISLAGNIESTGTLILPLLAFDDPVGTYTMDALKAMLQVDSDALRRALYTMSGQTFSECPITVVNREVLVQPRISSSLSTSQKRAYQLLEFVDSLPEQELFYDDML